MDSLVDGKTGWIKPVSLHVWKIGEFQKEIYWALGFFSSKTEDPTPSTTLQLLPTPGRLLVSAFLR